MKSLLSKRTRLRPLLLDDAEFIFELLNDADWLKYIGDKGVYNLRGAENYIINGPQRMYAQQGCGLLLVETLNSAKPIGLCGILQRDNLDIPDIGFAFLASERGQGLAAEAASAVIHDFFEHNELHCLAGITAKDNEASMTLLKKLGFVFSRTYFMPAADIGSNLFLLSKESWTKTASAK